MESRFRRSYSPNYFSLDDILATHERIPCKLEAPVPRLGFLDPSSESEDINVGTNIQLPLWLVQALKQPRVQIVSIDIPKVYKEAYREILKADASIVDLRKIAPYFYEFGAYLSLLRHRDAPAINKMLVNTFKDRFRTIMDWSQNTCTDVLGLQKLDTLEKELYQEGVKSRNELNSWLIGSSSMMAPSLMVVNHKKRKRALNEL